MLRSIAWKSRMAATARSMSPLGSSARALGVSLPGTALMQQLFNSCKAHGGARWDHSAVVKVLELLAGRELAP